MIKQEDNKMEKMFCFQCEQTAGCTGCSGSRGVCGKGQDTARLQDELTGVLIGIARASDGNEVTKSTTEIIIEGLFATLTNVNFDNDSIRELIRRAEEEKEKLIPKCSGCGSP